jgi:DNA-binding response OmpR family regulator
MDFHPPSPFSPVNGRSTSPWGSRDKALIIEDNEGIAGLLTILLANFGLQVVWCQTGQDSLAKFAQHREAIALVIADCRLPDGDGREVCRQMREQLPDLPLLLSSGSMAYLNVGPLQSGRLVRFMPKPYAPAEMLAHVRKLQAEAMQATAAISAGFV